MNLYTLIQREQTGYDTFDSCVVAAESAEAARMLRPDGHSWGDDFAWCSSWATKLENVEVQLIGTAVEGMTAGVVISSFNAG